MVLLRRVIIVVAALVLAAQTAGSASAATDGIAAWRLYDHKTSVRLGQQVTMWECWADLRGSDPKLRQKVGKRWVLLDTATVGRDLKKCGRDQPIKAVYTFTLRDALRWNEEAKSYEAVLETICSTCVTYDWTALVVK